MVWYCAALGLRLTALVSGLQRSKSIDIESILACRHCCRGDRL
jgi:hypothetical protein